MEAKCIIIYFYLTMEIIYHILGICPDSQSHFDLANLLITWDSFMLCMSRISLFFMQCKILIMKIFI
jgi:hypothetical protein